ncbi:MAG: lysophospholipase, partial [Proteobacteria bacterium]|nr:lysophospholipase [Pseudomonadota bacterium]
RRVQLNAFAGGTAETIGAARRLSLSRALTVRSYLIDQGVRSTDIDVRALGIPETGEPERVDVLLEPS